jgi:hypothetical protein
MTSIEKFTTPEGDEIEFEKVEEEPENINGWFKRLIKEAQKPEKPINVIDPKERNVLLGGYFRKMVGSADAEGRLASLPIKGIGNRELMIVSPSGHGLHFQQEAAESGETFSDYKLFGKNETKRRLENALRIYPARIQEIEQDLEKKNLPDSAKKEITRYLGQLKTGEVRSKKLLENRFL